MQLFAVSRTEQGIRRRQAEARNVALSLVPKPDPVPAPEPTPTREEIERMVTERVRAEVKEAMVAANQALRDFHALWDAQNNVNDSCMRNVPHPMKMAEVIRRILKATKISREDLFSARRTVKIAFVRQAVFYWAVRRTAMSYARIGDKLGRDHTVVLHGVGAYVKKRADQGRRLRALR